ncbi:MAG: hypothetical protein AAGC74_13345, partial [Verrucomicrobiota bacterium]
VGEDFEGVLRGVRERCVLAGKRVGAWVGGERLEGGCEGIGRSGELLVRVGGEVRGLIQADEVRIEE